MANTFHNGPRLAYAHETVGTLTSAKGLTAATHSPLSTVVGTTLHPEQAFITVETADIRWTIDSTVPTTTTTTAIGHIAGAADVILLEGNQNIERFSCINAVASNGASLRVTYLR
jgi:hypothetical protein